MVDRGRYRSFIPLSLFDVVEFDNGMFNLPPLSVPRYSWRHSSKPNTRPLKVRAKRIAARKARNRTRKSK